MRARLLAMRLHRRLACSLSPPLRARAAARLLRFRAVRGAAAITPERAADRATTGVPAPQVGVFASSLGNVFMRELADDLAADLAAGGAAVLRLDETAPEPLPLHRIFVAPHEFFLLGRGRDRIRGDVIAGATMLNTEQAQTGWFALALPFLLAARGVIDLDVPLCSRFAAAGVPTLHLTLAPRSDGAQLDAADRRHPLLAALPAAAHGDPDAATNFAARVLDIAFFGTATPRRTVFFARHAAFFAAHASIIHCRRPQLGPIRDGGADAALSRLARHVGGHARITLNLHRDAAGYFEWHRIVRLGMSMGSVVVSEPCPPHPAFRPGVHYFEAAAPHLPELLAWLLHDADGRSAAQRAQVQARCRLAEQFAAPRTAARVLAFLLDGAARNAA